MEISDCSFTHHFDDNNESSRNIHAGDEYTALSQTLRNYIGKRNAGQRPAFPFIKKLFNHSLIGKTACSSCLLPLSSVAVAVTSTAVVGISTPLLLPWILITLLPVIS